MWISNAPEADVYAVFARTSEDGPTQSSQAFVGPAQEPKGSRASRSGAGSPRTPLERLSYNSIRAGARPGDPARPEQQLHRGDQDIIDLFRQSIEAFAVADIAQAALDAAVDHAAEHEAFGRPLSHPSAISIAS